MPSVEKKWLLTRRTYVGPTLAREASISKRRRRLRHVFGAFLSAVRRSASARPFDLLRPAKGVAYPRVVGRDKDTAVAIFEAQGPLSLVTE